MSVGALSNEAETEIIVLQYLVVVDGMLSVTSLTASQNSRALELSYDGESPGHGAEESSLSQISLSSPGWHTPLMLMLS